MKKTLLSLILTIFMICLTVASVRADIPELINFQGRVTDTAGTPLNGDYSITFRIYDAQSGGAILWNETQSTVSVNNGIFSILLGSVSTLNIAFDIPYWISMEVNNDGEMTPRQAITSVGYSFHAKTSDSADNGIPVGTIIIRRGVSCPAGYTRVTELDGKFLTGGSTYNAAVGGSNTSNHGGNTGNTSLSIAQMPSHNHPAKYRTGDGINRAVETYDKTESYSTDTTLIENTGGGQPHNHLISSDDNRPEFSTVLLCEKN
ncbi:hypothetical protein MNBD_UNCLBAC01-817 [hydrothermal vent metagenome]|uniref:Phage tail collar domain-containing protein n=1 Tax=hydrothermal vent metagenome TaxID=652676 RepID=A0A3B1DED0_9ZZZZ